MKRSWGTYALAAAAPWVTDPVWRGFPLGYWDRVMGAPTTNERGELVRR
jgi:hypothetical protein